MSSNTTLARPYAKAAFDVASKQSALEHWGDALAQASVVASQETMAEWLSSPDYQADTAVSIIREAVGAEAGEAFTNFLSVMARNDRLAVLPEVAGLFAALRQDAENRLPVRVVSAVPLNDDQSQRMSQALAKRFEREIELSNDIDPEIIGGAVIYAGDEVIDGSVRGRLSRLENSLL